MTERMTLEDLDRLNAGRPAVWLDIGAGGFSTDSRYLAVDAYTEADIVATMWDLPLPDNSVDGIYSSHALEHITKFAVVPTLQEWNRVLKPGGELLLVLPDLEWVCMWWLAHPDVGWNMDSLFGNQKHGGEFHQTGFTPKILKDYFDVAGGYNVRKIDYDAETGYDRCVSGSELIGKYVEPFGVLTEEIIATLEPGQKFKYTQQRLIRAEATKVRDEGS